MEGGLFAYMVGGFALLSVILERRRRLALAGGERRRRLLELLQ